MRGGVGDVPRCAARRCVPELWSTSSSRLQPPATRKVDPGRHLLSSVASNSESGSTPTPPQRASRAVRPGPGGGSSALRLPHHPSYTQHSVLSRGGPIGASKVCPAQARPGVSSTGVKSTGVPSIDETSTVANVAGQLRGPPLQQAGGQAGRMAAARQAALPLPLRLLRRLLRLPTRRRARGHTGARACLERGRLPRRHGLPTRQVWMRQVWVRLQLLVQHLHVGLGDNLPHRGVKHQVGASLAAHRLGGGGRVGVGNHPQPRAPVPHPAARVELVRRN
mmetsp:Transcript_34432/g.102274  ORF Transcript_34432/g.102274 Transcript_34432/m.102274 type:complete len:279 (-) Transcript_34432:450-1286(-)